MAYYADLFLGAEQESNPLGLQLLSDRGTSMLIEPAHRLLQYPIAHRGRPHDQSAVGDGLGNRLVFFSVFQQFGGAYGGAGFAETWGVGIYQAQAVSSEIAHSSSRGANVQRIAWAHQHHDETV